MPVYKRVCVSPPYPLRTHARTQEACSAVALVATHATDAATHELTHAYPQGRRVQDSGDEIREPGCACALAQATFALSRPTPTHRRTQCQPSPDSLPEDAFTARATNLHGDRRCSRRQSLFHGRSAIVRAVSRAPARCARPLRPSSTRTAPSLPARQALGSLF